MQRMTRNPGDRLFGMACGCGVSRPFAVTAGALVCDDCGRRIDFVTPVMGVEDGSCECGPGTTFVLEATGDMICTRCGHRRIPQISDAG